MGATHAEGIPRPVIPEDSRICPGSVFTPTGTGNCLCGQERQWHFWAHDGPGAFVRVTERPAIEPARGVSAPDDALARSAGTALTAAGLAARLGQLAGFPAAQAQAG